LVASTIGRDVTWRAAVSKTARARSGSRDSQIARALAGNRGSPKAIAKGPRLIASVSIHAAPDIPAVSGTDSSKAPRSSVPAANPNWWACSSSATSA
jgi:hypothetical protein